MQGNRHIRKSPQFVEFTFDQSVDPHATATGHVRFSQVPDQEGSLRVDVDMIDLDGVLIGRLGWTFSQDLWDQLMAFGGRRPRPTPN